jgi:hypothetical protein
MDDNYWNFMVEAFLPKAHEINASRDEYYHILQLAHKAYYINPDHLSASQSEESQIKFFSYESDIDLHALMMPANSATPIRYFFGPEYLV